MDNRSNHTVRISDQRLVGFSGYTVTVSNIGIVLSAETVEDARPTFEDYAIRSVLSTGSRAYRETVSLLAPSGEPVETFSDPWTDEDGEPVDDEDLGASVLDLLESGEIEGDVYSVGSSYDPWTWTDYAAGGSVSWRELRPVSGPDYRERMLSGEFLVLVPYACSGSDYSGGSLARANVSALQEIADADSVVSFSLSGSHGFHGIGFPLWVRGTELGLVSALRGLSSYPVVSEDALSEIEREEEEETWESSIRSDLVRELESVHGVDVDEIAEDALARLFLDLQEATGETWEHTEEGPWISVERLMDGTTRAALLEIPGAVSASADDERDAARVLLSLRETVDALPSLETLQEIADGSADGDSAPILETLEGVREDLAKRAGLLSVSEDPLASLVSLVREIGSLPSSYAEEIPEPTDADRSVSERLVSLASALSSSRSAEPGTVSEIRAIGEEIGRGIGPDARTVSERLQEIADGLEREPRDPEARAWSGLRTLARGLSASGADPRPDGTVLRRLQDSRSVLVRARDLARERVLPALLVGDVGEARDLAETWERDAQTGLPVLSAYGARVERAYRESVLSGLSGSDLRDRARSVRSGLSLVSEEALRALHESGASPEDAARSLLLDRIAEDVERAGWILVREEDGTSPRGDVLCVDREREEIRVRILPSGEERTVPLRSQAYRVRS
jgi:hypothetical protein